MKKGLLGFCFGMIALAGNAQMQWPAVTNTNKPWTRWWWEGSAVNKPDITWNLEQYQKAGIGGVELTPIYGVYGHEKEFIDFLSPKWMEHFVYTLRGARKLGMGVDLANGTGWPFGGPWVKDQDASKSIYYKMYPLSEGQSLPEKIIYTREVLVRTANNKTVSADTLLQPVTRNKDLQSLALDQLQYAGNLPLQLLMAYSENGQAIDITKYVAADGQLDWKAPSGKWTLYALFEGLHGKMVERAAPGGEGYAIDHFSLAAANNYFKRFDQAFKGYDLSYLRSFFNDSYEVDDAKGQANWTPLLLDEFKKRKGYDLRHHLPALFGKGTSAGNARVIYDYRSVIDDLLLEHFTKTWKTWAAGKNKMVRNQSHGSPANTLDLYSVVDIPETEGNDILRFKFATSAANVTGKKLVSSESATWLNEHFLSSWADVKKIVDLFFLGGVNHIFYHGTAYSPKEAPWPGWLFYAAVHFQPTNPQWKDFHALNTYITRVQSFLQGGKPDNDVLLYYPIIDRYSQPGNALLQHFDGMEKNFEHTAFEELSKTMLEKGYGFDFFSDRQLKQFTMAGKKIQTGGNAYQTILLPANKLIDEKTFEKLMDLAKRGATILAYKHLPDSVPGLFNLEERQNKYQQLVDRLKFEKKDGLSTAQIGAGVVMLGDDVDQLLQAARVRKESLADKKLSMVRRRNANGTFYFISNRNEKSFADWITLQTPAASVAVFNPMTGETGLAKTRRLKDGQTEAWIELKIYESLIIQTYTTAKNGGLYPFMDLTGEPVALQNQWRLRFLDGGPVLPDPVKPEKLQSWTALTGEHGKHFSGTASYTTTFDRPNVNASHFVLDLGKVHETAEVKLNGKAVATLIGPDYKVTIPVSLLNPSNHLEIIVANLMANRIIHMDQTNQPWKIFYNTNMPARKKENAKDGIFTAAEWKPLPSGLLGPVTLTPAEPLTVTTTK
ncbi:glycoside hydrolase family 2 protein [Terrimonas sp. NA20]|uniref:Glycoside hydrolase family 2 protein n=1 Tax=Terrimonas ginsenosidimutans TaxID=2908004 RepID=A0ABS9KPI1_9BACT|nr:glycosyl hydrolase [Terrimonas ginsenosidimutans]MCG2614238.1 glycoside hydrolase family 2 protein [Terrimonas ginsenosidimutans]